MPVTKRSELKIGLRVKSFKNKTNARAHWPKAWLRESLRQIPITRAASKWCWKMVASDARKRL